MSINDRQRDPEKDVRARDSAKRGVFHGCGSLERGCQTEPVLAAEQRFRLVVEAAPSAMVMIDPTGAIVMVNAQLERVFGYSRDEVLGQSVEILVPPRYRAHHPGM